MPEAPRDEAASPGANVDQTEGQGGTHRLDVDICRIIAVLDERDVRCVLVGALGAVAHGARLRTGDVDLCPALDDANLRRVAAMLRALDGRLIRVPPPPSWTG